MTSLDFYALPWYKKILVKIAEFFVAIGKGVANFVIGAPGAVWRFIKMIGRGLGWLGSTFVHGDALTKLSYIIMGAGNLFRGQIIKGLIFIAAEVAYIGFMIDSGLGWTLVWAFLATFLNYFFGIILAMLINKKGVKFKSFYRTLFVLAIAVPQFVSLLVMKNVFAEAGPVNVLLQDLGWISAPLPFFTDPMWARMTIIAVNLWIGIPYTMLIVSGILMNIPDDLYEAARIDGASPFVTFRKITMPYVLFVTTPYLITQLVGNINNFNVIYFLTGGTPATLDYYQAGKTDLLVTWLYKLTVNSRDYSYAATIGILVFIICSLLSLITFRRSASYKNEEAFQ